MEKPVGISIGLKGPRGLGPRAAAPKRNRRPPTLTEQARRALAQAASVPPTGWLYLLSGTGTAAEPLVANIEYGFPTPGSQIIVWPLTPNPSNELWMLTIDGYIISQLDSNLCMTIVDGNVVANPVTAFGDTSQLWTLETNGTIANQASGQVLTVGNGQNVGVADFDSTLPASQNWSIYPNNPLTAILAQSPDPFPTWASGTDLGNVYAAMMTQLGGGQASFDLRSQYTNLAAPLGAWQATLLTMPCPGWADSGDWSTVQLQLAQELTAAIAVQRLFDNYIQCHQALFSSQEALLNKVIEDASIEVSTTTSGIFAVVLWNILYVAGESNSATATLTNIVQAAINIAQAVNNQGVVATDTFQVAVSDLWNLLAEGFDEILLATATIENELLGDWGMLQASYAQIIDGAQGNLAWPADLTATIVANATIGIQTSLLQVLIPSKYEIFYTSPGNVYGPPPASCLWTTSPANEWFEIGSLSGNTFSFPDYMMQNDILANGVQLESFYWGFNGWSTPMSGGPFAETLTLLVTNQTDQFVTATIGQEGMDDYTMAPISPWQSSSYSWECGSLDGSASVSITDSGGGKLATFQIYQEDGAYTPVVSSQSLTTGYSLTAPVCYPGLDGGPGSACQITILAIGTLGGS
jgi:Ricin-type beta-trefoil lectin domain